MTTGNKICIEVCERMMDSHQVPVWCPKSNTYYLERQPKYHAQIKDKPGYWSCGTTREEAVGGLIRNHPEMFNVELSYLEGKLAR